MDFTKTNKAMQILENSLKKRGLHEEKDGKIIQHCEVIYPSYDDRISEKSALEILGDNYPEDRFNEWVDSMYDEYIRSLEREVIDEVMKEMYPKDADEKAEIREYLQEELDQRLTFELPYDHYLDQEFNVDITMDTGDANFDFSCNSPYPYYYGVKGDGIQDESSLVWLAATQGYSKRELEKALDNDAGNSNPVGFLETVRQEVENETSMLNRLVFLTKMSLRDLMKVNNLIKLQEPNGKKIYTADIRPECGSLTVKKGTVTGLFDPFNGGGSVLEIELEKDVEIPIKYIGTCYPDSYFTWSITSIYGMCSSAWKEDMVYGIKGPEVA